MLVYVGDILREAEQRGRLAEHDECCPWCHPFEYITLPGGKCMKRERVPNRCVRGRELAGDEKREKSLDNRELTS